MDEQGQSHGLTSLTGATREGLPLGYSRAPCAELTPWLSRFAVTQVELPPGQSVACAMLQESAGMRILFGAAWTAHTVGGRRDFVPPAEGMTLMFGPQSRAMPVTVHGSFEVVTINFAAGAMLAMGGPLPRKLRDETIDYDRMVGHGRLSSHYRRGSDPESGIAAIERQFLKFIDLRRPPRPHPLVAVFEQAVLSDPTFLLKDFAEAQQVSSRTLERVIGKAMGVTPHHALRRARALDMAAVLLRVAIEEEEPDLRLRYFDQSHLIREMRYFFDCTPRQMLEDPHPLLRIVTEIRQARRVAMLERVAQGELVPWRDPEAEPGRNPLLNRKAS